MAIVIPPPFALAQPVLSLLPPTVTRLNPIYVSLPGETVAVFGANFFDIVSVDFNGVPASFVVLDEHWLNVVVPNSQTAGPIYVTNRRGVGIGYFRVGGRAVFSNALSATMQWDIPVADDGYSVMVGRPIIIDGGAVVSIAADGTSRTQTGITIHADAAFSGYVDGYICQPQG